MNVNQSTLHLSMARKTVSQKEKNPPRTPANYNTVQIIQISQSCKDHNHKVFLKKLTLTVCSTTGRTAFFPFCSYLYLTCKTMRVANTSTSQNVLYCNVLNVTMMLQCVYVILKIILVLIN